MAGRVSTDQALQTGMPAVVAIKLGEKLGTFAQAHQRAAGGLLLERAQQGDEQAFSLLFEQYANAVFNFIYRMIGQRDVAEDLTQETFVRAYRKIKGLRLQADTQLSTWLFSIAKNVARESFRSQQTDKNTVGLEGIDKLKFSGGDPKPDEQLWDKEFQHIVQQGLETLDPDKRLVFVLRVFQQCSYEEIATITGYSMSKLKTDLYRARIEMRSLLRPYLEPSS
jgi:RNA polymerase sigma-70 factor, ECF subfamily